ncbi:MAG: nucleotidyltransferase domain-containing protein [Pseudomonadota bacterium]|jgi:hypothetical protein
MATPDLPLRAPGGSPLRAIPPDLDPQIVASIDRTLDRLTADENVRIPLAIESGSRAWGFPSPDSDYDCRFVYQRPLQDYASLYPARDVIETPLDPVFDIGGWDLAKALKLMVRGNAVIIEWLTSPIIYRADAGFRDRMLALAAAIVDRNLVARHYQHLALSIRQKAEDGGDGMPIKKLFYILRPAIALRWLRQRPIDAVAPMHFPTLCASTDLNAAERNEIERMLAEKARTREIGRGAVPPLLVDLIERELDLASDWIAPERMPEDARRRQADAFFWAEVSQTGA